MSAARYELGLVGHSAGWPMMSRTTAAASTTTSREVTSRGLALGQPASLSLRAIPTLQPASRNPEIPQRSKRIDYEARAIAAGGLKRQQTLVFPGGALIGAALVAIAASLSFQVSVITNAKCLAM